jgi:hypothetical protein
MHIVSFEAGELLGSIHVLGKGQEGGKNQKYAEQMILKY